MTAVVIWPGATAQQIQDELLNRMEKKFEQLDHFEKVKTYARQGYGGMTITVVGGTSKADQQRSLVPGAQEVQRHQARASRRRHRPDLQRRIRRRDGAALRREERRHQPRRALRRGRRHQAAAAQGADGEEGRPLRQAGEEGLRRVLAPAPRRARHHAGADRREPAQPEQRAGKRLDRHERRPGAGARERPVREPGRYPQRADRRRRAH